MVALPNCVGTGVTVTVREAPLPPRTMFAAGTSAGLEEKVVRARLPAAVSTSPTVKLIGPVDESSRIVLPVIAEIVGCAFARVVTADALLPAARPTVDENARALFVKNPELFGFTVMRMTGAA